MLYNLKTTYQSEEVFRRSIPKTL